MAKKRRQSPVKKEYFRQRRRIQSALRRATKRGYIVPEDFLPSIPKTITQGSVNRLSKLTINKLYEKSVKVDFDTGEFISGKQARNIERKEAAQRAAQTRKERRYNKETRQTEQFDMPSDYAEFPSETEQIISNFKADVISRYPESAGPTLQKWLDELIRNYGENDVAQMLQNAADNGLIIDYSVAYDEEKLMNAIAEFMDYLPEASTGYKEEIIEQLEYEENWEVPE